MEVLDSNAEAYEGVDLLLPRAVEVALALSPDPLSPEPAFDGTSGPDDRVQQEDAWKKRRVRGNFRRVSDEAVAGLIVDAGALVPDERLPRYAWRWPLVVHALGNLGTLGTEESKGQTFDLLKPIEPIGKQTDVAVELFGRLGETGVSYAQEFFTTSAAAFLVDRVRLHQLDTMTDVTWNAISSKVWPIQDPRLKILAIERALTRAPDLDKQYRSQLIDLVVEQSLRQAAAGSTSWFLDLRNILETTHDDRIVAMLENHTSQGGGLNIQRLLLDGEYRYRAIAYDDPSYIDKIFDGNSRIGTMATLALRQTSEEKQRELVEQAFALYEQGDPNAVTGFPLARFIGIANSTSTWLVERYQELGESRGLARLVYTTVHQDTASHNDELASSAEDLKYQQYAQILDAILAVDFEAIETCSEKQQSLAYTAIASSNLSVDIQKRALGGLRGKESWGYLALPEYTDAVRHSIIAVNDADFAEVLLKPEGAGDRAYIEVLTAMVVEKQNTAALQKLLTKLEDVVARKGRDLEAAYLVKEAITAIALTLGVLASANVSG